ncbi:hypothetical protein LTR17_009602 [Elasticomyces elasticus]|nr:hypothetical protein LTR17_009602 [Elasticomyces elasticus]
MLAQDQSIFFTLPAEIREEIYAYSLIAERPITNPAPTLPVGQNDKDIPPLGTALLRSCRRVYNEIDPRALYESNTYRFTKPMISTEFFNHLSEAQRALIRGISCDLRTIDYDGRGVVAGPGGISVGNDWFHYLGCTPRRHSLEGGCTHPTQPEMLCIDMPSIKILTFDLTALQDIADQHVTLVKPTIQRLLLGVLRILHRNHYGSVRLAKLQEVQVVGRDDSGKIVTLSTGRSYLAPESDQEAPNYAGQAAQALQKLACIGVDYWTGWLLPSAFNGTSSPLATGVQLQYQGRLHRPGTSSLSGDQQYFFWEGNNLDPGTWDTTIIRISRVFRYEDNSEGGDALTLALCLEFSDYVFDFLDKDEGWSQYCAVKQIVERSLSQKTVSE